MKAIKCKNKSINSAHYTLTQTVTNTQSLSCWKDLLTCAYSIGSLHQELCVDGTQHTPIADTTPVLHQYSAKSVRNIIQDMNFNMTLIEPSIQVII